MKLITREDYLNKLINVIGTPDIKIITGVRRSGKSKLLESFINYINLNITDANIIHINFSLTEFENLKEYHALTDYVSKRYIEGKNNFLLIDEVQLCDKFELAINSFHAQEKYDIYITGSNAFLLSSDLVTLFTGRTFEIEVFPFSFKEFMEYYEYDDPDKYFDEYVSNGGMSGSYLYKTEKERYSYIDNIYRTLIARDIERKYKIKNKAILESVNNFLIDNISNLTSSNNITEFLNKNNIKITNKTIDNYIQYLCNAFVFYKVNRYDIRGKQYLKTLNKYYIVDHSFRYAKLGTINIDYGRTYENIVAIELLRRGYKVYIGTLYNKEIDFVATKQNERIYIQVSSYIDNNDTFNREVSSLLKIKDAYPKILIARTRQPNYTYEGIQIIDIANWLVNK